LFTLLFYNTSVKTTTWRVDSLIQLLRNRYKDWQDCAHPLFFEDEIKDKRHTIAKAATLINVSAVDSLIATGEYEELITRFDRIARDNNLLWRQVPSVGDTAVLTHPNLDKPTFCAQMRNLIYGDRPTPDRLQSFSDYLTTNSLPNKWTFPTYFLFICHPEKEMFVKPRTAEWQLKFMGVQQSVTSPPNQSMYREIAAQSNALREELAAFGAEDMVHVQSILWVCAQASKERIGRLNTKGQIDLDIPPSLPEAQDIYKPVPAMALIQEPNPSDFYNPVTRYTLNQCAQEIYIPESMLSQWIEAIHRKGQAIFYGPPGTGKTFVAQKLAQHLVSEDEGSLSLVQFHPAYAYEDFIQGIRPLTQPDGTFRYEMIPGRFLQFCEVAHSQVGICVLIIDEINRANLASIFGELMYLLEYRDAAVPLAGGGTLSIPANVRILGTMNTADRSIALVDHALRRRFSFIHLQPDFEIIRQYHKGTGFDPTGLIQTLKRVNDAIGDPHYQVGHSFFLHKQLETACAAIWQMEIEPYLEEFFFNQPDQVTMFRWQNLKTDIIPHVPS
jgi:hypothetical protein